MTFQQFRMRLVEMIDRLLEILDGNYDYKYFMLDGQTILLDDYLEIRPENKERLKKHIQSGRILIGPWHVLGDEFLVNGESLIRNLLWGHKTAKEWGEVAKVGYLPDQFGHISQLPQILRGFEIDNVIFWRGSGIPWEDSKSEFLWEGPDGSKILTHRLPIHPPDNEGYFNAARLPLESDKAYQRIKYLKEDLSAYATSNNLLLMNGVDHMLPQETIPQTIKEVNRRLKGGEIIHSNLFRFIQSIKRSKPHLVTIKGEFYSSRYTRIHPGVLSTRIHLKQAHLKSENLLQRWAEPFSALAWVEKNPYPKPFLDLAWRYFFQNHPHDTLYGCCIDAVDKETMSRYSLSREISEHLAIKSLHQLAKEIDTSFTKDGEVCLVVFNPLNWSRTDWVNGTVVFPPEMKVKSFKLEDDSGNSIPFYFHERESYTHFFHPVKYISWEKKTQFQISFLAKNVPAFGYKVYVVKPGGNPRPSSGQRLLSPEKSVLENEYLKISIRKNGTFDVIDKKSDVIYKRCHYFEDGGDAGTLYNYSYPRQDKIITNLEQNARIALMENTETFARYKIETKLLLPIQLTLNRKRRSKKLTRYSITSYITLAAGVPRIEIQTVVENQVKDHRLRVLFPTEIKTDFSYAEGQFDVLQRSVKLPGDFTGWAEKPMPTYPQRTFVDVSDGKRGIAVLNRGLPEYEIRNDKKRTIAITLLRGVQWITAPDLLTVRSHKGDPFWQFCPEGQCLGKYIFHYSLYPHLGDWKKGRVYQQAYQHNIGCRVIQIEKNRGKLPKHLSFIVTAPTSLIVTCLKKAEDSNSLILRVFNVLNKEAQAKIVFYRKVKRAYLVDFREEKIKKLKVRDKMISFAIPGKKIFTLEVCL